MAVITNTFNTYEAKGIKEDLSDLISDISPTGSSLSTERSRMPLPW